MTLEYLDFDLEIGEGSGRDYRVTARSLAGEARAIMRFPYDELALESRFKDLQIALLSSGGTRRKILPPEQKSVREFGQDLFDALFSGEIRNRYDVSLQQARSQGKGLRIRLSFQSPLAAALPWEYLFDPRQAEYCSLSVETPLVRYLELSQPIAPLTVTPPLRILGMVSSPSGLSALDVDQEKQRIEHATRALRMAGRIELQWVQGQTWRDLQSALRKGPWHIFHFSGHGQFDTMSDEGQLVFADDQGRPRLLQASDVGRFLANHRTLRVAWLNACEGAQGSKLDIFSSTASILVRRGIPAVIAMQYDISDRVAIELARTFYEALADGYPVDAALAEARVAVSVAVNNTIEWGTSVLYMQSPDGRIFDLPAWIGPSASLDRDRQQAGPEPRRLQPSSKPVSDQLKPSLKPTPEPDLDERYIQALEYFWTERWSDASALLNEIVVQQPDYPGAAAKFEHAQRQQTLATRFTEAGKAYDAALWATAIEHLETVVELDPDYGDAAARLAEAKRKLALAELYAEARRLFDAQAWQAVVKVFDRIHEQDAACPDPDGLLPTTREMLAAHEHERKLAALYKQAMRDMDGGRLDEARQGFEEVVRLSSDYKQAGIMLARVVSAMVQREVEAKRQAHLAELSGRVSDLVAARDWEGAEETLIELRKTGASQTEVATLLAEVRRQHRLEALYQQGLAHFQAQRWRDSMAAVEELVRSDPEYAPPGLEHADILLARVLQAEQEDDRREQDERRARLADSLYRQADELLVARDWQGAVELLSQVQDADPSFRDVESKLKVARWQQYLAEQFTTALVHFQAGRWQDASAAFQALVQTEPDYVDPTWGTASSFLLNARQQRELAELPTPPTGKSRKLPEEPMPSDQPEARSGPTKPATRPKDLPK